MTAETENRPDERELLAAEYVLGTLEGAEKTRAEALLSDAAFYALVMEWHQRLAALDDTAEAVSAPPALWQKIEAGLPLRAIPVLLAKKPASSRLFSGFAFSKNLAFWRGFGLAGAMASLILAIGLVQVLHRAPLSPVSVAVLNTGDGRAAAVVNAYADGTVELIPLDQIAVPQERIIEVWTLQDKAQGPVSIGRMAGAQRLKLDLKTLKAPDVNHLFELTLEPRGGSPTGKPTGPVLMKGLMARGI